MQAQVEVDFGGMEAWDHYIARSWWDMCGTSKWASFLVLAGWPVQIGKWALM